MRRLPFPRVLPDSESRSLFGWNMPMPKPGVGFTAGLARTASGPPSLIADDSESDVLVIAPTGAGKGRNFIIPNLLTCEAPAIVLDIKGEAARVTARRRRDMGHEVVILDPFHIVTDEPASLNPLDRVTSNPESVADEAFMLASLVSEGLRGTKEPFWDDLGESLIAGLFAYVATSDETTSRTLGAVWDLLTTDDTVYDIAVLLDKTSKMHVFAKQQLSAFLAHEPQKVRTSVLSVAQQHLRIFASQGVQRAVAATSFDLAKVQSGAPLTIYIVVPPTKIISHGALIRLWLSTLLGVITERTVAPERP